MKRVVLSISIVLLCIISVAQVPESFSYQAIVRDGGEVLPDQLVSYQFSIIKGTPPGTVVYTEKHSVTTNQFGLITLAVGNGTDKTGSFTTIDWGADSYFLKVEIDPTGVGTVYTDMGTNQLLSVPYALHAKTVASYTEIDPKIGSNTGNYLSKWDGSALVSSSIFDNGNIGIGLSDPGQKLSVSGNIYASEYIMGTRLYVGDDEYFFRDAEDIIKTDDSFEVSRIGINHDPSSTYELYVSGQAYVTDYLRATNYVVAEGGIHVGGTSDPDTDNLIVDGKTGLGGINPVRNLHVKDIIRLEPRSTAPSSPSEGDIYMDSGTHKLMVYDGTYWKACWE